MMNTRLFATSFFLGILATLVTWAFQWALDSREEVTFHMPGEVTVLGLIKGAKTIASADANEMQEKLKAYLHDRSLALIVSSSGDGRPEIVLYDPHNLLPWFPGYPSEGARLAWTDVYIFRGTYSEKLWKSSLGVPFLPQGAVVRGIIAAPRRAGNLQYVRCVGRELLPEGQYTFNTTDPVQVQHIISILYQMGFVVRSSTKTPFFLYLVQNPLVVITLFFLLAAYGCVVFYWSLYLHIHSRAREFGIRSRHGALPADLVWENLLNGLPGLVSGIGMGGNVCRHPGSLNRTNTPIARGDLYHWSRNHCNPHHHYLDVARYSLHHHSVAIRGKPCWLK